MDIEGAEVKALQGCDTLLKLNAIKESNLIILVCPYHYAGEEDEVKELMANYKYQIKPSYGYLIPIFEKKITFPYIRRGVFSIYPEK